MKIEIETTSYNERRYGKPWIAIVNFAGSTKGDYSFGDWTGDHRNGGYGVLTLDAAAGDIIARGQKDYRNSRNSSPDFSVLLPTGELKPIGGKGDAYKYFLDHQQLDVDSLKKERETLVARIAEIDAILGGGN